METMTARLMLHMTPQEKAALAEIAKKQDVSMAEVIRRLITRSAARYGIKTAAAA
jgi:hypothetical protein